MKKVILSLISINLAIILMVIVNINLNVPKHMAPHVVSILYPDGSIMGTGFNIEYKDKVFILTNAHICSDNVELKTSQGLKKVIKQSDSSDLCLLESSATSGLTLSLREPAKFSIVHIVGHPGGWRLTARSGLTTGIEMQNKVRHRHVAVPAFPGNSGSPGCNANGEVVGVLSMVSMKTFEDTFFVPLDEIKVFMERHGR